MPLSLRITPLVFLAMVTCSLPLTVSIYEKGSCNEDKNKSDQNNVEL